MEFEDILKDIGGFGTYQKILIVVFLFPTFIVLPWFFLGLLFMANTPEHWCYVPEIAHSNLSLDLQKQLIRSKDDGSCFMHDVNYTRILHAEKLNVDPSWRTRKCDKGWKYDETYYDSTVVTKWNLVCKDAHYNSLLLSMIFAGCVFGPPVFGFVADKLGRKRIFCCLVLIVALLEIGSIFSPYFVLFLVLRALLASVTSTIYACGYIILLELVSPDYRSWINGLATNFWTLGLCLLPLMAWITRSWVRLSAVIASCAAGLSMYWNGGIQGWNTGTEFIPLSMILPESPRWLLSKEEYDEAHALLLKISIMNGNGVHKDDQLMGKIKLVGKKMKNQKIHEQNHSPLNLFKHPHLRRRLFLVTMCWIAIANTYYGLQVNVRNLSGNEFLNFFLVSLVEIPSHLVTWLLLERVGRRFSMILGFSISGAACLIPAVTPPDIPMIDVIASLVAKAGMSCCYMTLYQQAPEIFPTALRCQGMAISHSIASASTLLMPFVVNLSHNAGGSIQFIIFCAISCIAGIFASFLPETLNKNLPQTIEDIEKLDKDFRWCCYCSFRIFADRKSEH